VETTAHALLRDRRHWRGRMRGLVVAPSGDLELMRIPAPTDGKPIDMQTAYPCPRDTAGIAAGPGGAIFVADTAHDRILYVDVRCGTQSWLPGSADNTLNAPGHFTAPRGLAVDVSGLWIADSGHDCLQHLAFPQLEPHLAHPLRAPGAVAGHRR